MTQTEEEGLVSISRELASRVEELSFGSPVAYVYNPLRYARSSHEAYLEKFGTAPKECLLLGMNPGPWGMAQTGVPFGDVRTVGEWLGIHKAPDRPPVEHPKRPILGLDCPRVEVSGKRLWSWARARFRTPDRFFMRFFVVNYCPLVFMEESARNRTPDRLPSHEKRPLFAACDEALTKTVELLRPRWVIGIGRFARLRAEVALAKHQVTIAEVLHPSPANPAANRGWQEKAEQQLCDLGVELS